MQIRQIGFATILTVLTLGTPQVKAQTTTEVESLRKDVEALKEGQKELQKTLQIIKDILMGKQPPLEDVYIGTENSMTMGDPAAKIVMIEFSDYQCPFCGRHANDTFSALVQQYVNTGRMRYVFKNFPLEQIHPQAEKAAEAAECMGEQGMFWEAHERLFKNQQALDVKELPAHALALGLDVSLFQKCLDSGKYAAKIQADLAEGAKLGVRGTPTFFLGYRDAANPKQMKAAEILRGALPLHQFQTAIEKLLNPPEHGAASN